MAIIGANVETRQLTEVYAVNLNQITYFNTIIVQFHVVIKLNSFDIN